MKKSTQATTRVRGKFRKRICKKPDGFCIMLYDLLESNDPVPANVELKGEFSVKGPLIPEIDAINIVFTGRWERDKRPGHESEVYFAMKSFAEEEPVTRDGIIKVLSSGLYKGIGVKTAEKIYDRFKKQSLFILNRQTDRLKEVQGIGDATVQNIIESVKESSELKALVEFLAVYDISLSKIKKIQEAFPDNPRGVIETDPFKLCQIYGFGFKKVDEIAAKLGTPLASPLRIQSAIDEVLKQGNSKGHLYIMKNALVKQALELLNSRTDGNCITNEGVEAELQVLELMGKRSIVMENDYDGNVIVYRSWDHHNEVNAAERLITLYEEPLDFRRSFFETQLEQLIDESEKVFNLTLSPKQRLAIRIALTEKACVITGGPGTGKTMILKIILWIYERNVKETYPDDVLPSVLLLAPTGKAARRMSDSSGRGAYTIHKGLGITPADVTTEFATDSLLTDDVGYVVCDEASMMDMAITAKLLDKIPDDAQFTLIGDADQLPSVGPGSVLGEIIESGVIPVVTLDVIYRQGKTSPIVKNAHRIRVGRIDLEYNGSQYAFKETEGSTDKNPDADLKTQYRIVDLYLRAVAVYGLKETQILCPRREKVVASALLINKCVQERLFGGKRVPKINVDGQVFYLGERIIQNKNTKKANNGDMGIIRAIRPDPEQEDSFIASIEFDFMEEGVTIDYYPEDFDHIQLAYAITCHKSQGSEFKAVIMPILQSQAQMLRRNLIYTSVTRAKEIIVLVGQKKALENGIRKKDNNTRNTMFGIRLKEKVYA